MMAQLLSILVLLAHIEDVWSHGRLIEPPSRASMWRYGYNTQPNYSDNQLFCGGVGVQYSAAVGGRCGICGDPFNGPRLHEAGGPYATGTIVREYGMGATMDIKVQFTANHKGWTEFRLCPNNDVTSEATQECLDQNVLVSADGQGSRFAVEQGVLGEVTYTVQLPAQMSCTQCVLQWRYHAGNSWGTDPDGTSCIGCGDQEEFYGCADIAITAGAIVAAMTDPVDGVTMPPGNDPNMDDYVDWEWGTEPTAGTIALSSVVPHVMCIAAITLYILVC